MENVDNCSLEVEIVDGRMFHSIQVENVHGNEVDCSCGMSRLHGMFLSVNGRVLARNV